MNPDVYRGLWGGKHCRDSIVQTTRDCDCSTTNCKASDNYYKQLEEVFKYSIPCGHVAGLIAESIQVMYIRPNNTHILFYGELCNYNSSSRFFFFRTNIQIIGCRWYCSLS